MGERLMPRATRARADAVAATTAQRLGTLVKSARDTMRKDKGLNGDLDRLPMLTWIMFLKFLDDAEGLRETEAQIQGTRFVPAIEPPYLWRDWAAPDDGITGDALIAFITNERATRPDGSEGPGLFAYLRGLQGADGGDRRDVIATVFRGTVNRMINGYLLRDVINKVDDIHFASSDEIHTLGALYETMLREMRDAAGDSGEFYTPRPVVRFMVQAVDPRLGETVLDPACGTGGFLVESYSHLLERARTVEDREILGRSIRGGEAKSLPYLLAQMNLLLHGVESPAISTGNSLATRIAEIGERDRVDVILTNPPFGGEEEPGIQGNFPLDRRTSETALLFLQLIMRKLKRVPAEGFLPARAAVVVPNSTLFADGVAARLRTELLRDFRLHTIVRLPRGVFAPYTDIATNILFFERAGAGTEDIWYYEVPLPAGRVQFTKTQPLLSEHLQPTVAWWNARTETDCAWRVSAREVLAAGANLDFPNPVRATAPSPGDATELLLSRLAEVEETLRTVRAAFAEMQANQERDAYPLVELGRVLRHRSEFINIDDSAAYKRCRVQVRAQGVVLRDIVPASKVKTKRQQVCRAGELLVAEIDAKVGGFGIVPDEMEGAIVSGHYFLYEVDDSLIDRAYLAALLRTKFFQDQVQAQGSTNYAAIRPAQVLCYRIPLPDLEEQRSIVAEREMLTRLEEQLRLARVVADEAAGGRFGQRLGIDM
jgi:type I restriction enzyme M protein